jgi:hypothetical protein
MKPVWRLAWLVLLALGALEGGLRAQPQEAPVTRPRLEANQPAAVPMGGVIQQQSRPFYVQGAVVALLSAGAVWAVCHGSRRQ